MDLVHIMNKMMNGLVYSHKHVTLFKNFRAALNIQHETAHDVKKQAASHKTVKSLTQEITSIR